MELRRVFQAVVPGVEGLVGVSGVVVIAGQLGQLRPQADQLEIELPGGPVPSVCQCLADGRIGLRVHFGALQGLRRPDASRRLDRDPLFDDLVVVLNQLVFLLIEGGLFLRQALVAQEAPDRALPGVLVQNIAVGGGGHGGQGPVAAVIEPGLLSGELPVQRRRLGSPAGSVVLDAAEICLGGQEVHLLQNPVVEGLDPPAGLLGVPVPAVAGADALQLLQGGQKIRLVKAGNREHIIVMYCRVGGGGEFPLHRPGRRAGEQSEGQQQAEGFFQHRGNLPKGQDILRRRSRRSVLSTSSTGMNWQTLWRMAASSPDSRRQRMYSQPVTPL